MMTATPVRQIRAPITSNRDPSDWVIEAASAAAVAWQFFSKNSHAPATGSVEDHATSFRALTADVYWRSRCCSTVCSSWPWADPIVAAKDSRDARRGEHCCDRSPTSRRRS
jgi:hypothetical protein